MHDVARLKELHHFGDLNGDAEELDAVERLAAELRGERLTVDDFHDHRQHVAGGDDVVNRHEERVIERGSKADVADHLIAARGVLRELARQNLDRDAAAEARVVRPPDRGAEALRQAVMQQLITWSERLDRRHEPDYTERRVCLA